MDSLVKEWALFLDRCLENRIRADLFDAAATQLHGTSPLPGRKLAALLLRPRSAVANSLDPRVIVYVERLLALKKVDASDVLSAAFQYSRDRPARAGEEGVASKEDPARWHNPPELEEIIFHRLHKAFSTGERPVTNAEAVRTLFVVSGWMASMVTSHTNDSMIQAMAGIQQHPQQQSLNVREALGMLLVGLIENIRILELLSKDELKGRCIQFLSSTCHMTLNRGLV
jgi:mediator of RNA polymerase II transcription subunit 5